ncbi:hypothetical protein [Rhodococcus sp. UNC23MFCrub1.1]|uniref:hypothetical protein n=1 Tax=Rhodococcus sp. UNC23MFCrub1.1 TaxID=1449068 RepID=UPI0012DE614A|nr:hypothetical protein [Rhodococcus sp. UNC23MFCrub1.1]
MAAGLAVGTPGTANAGPAFDPDGDGVVTQNEVLDASLVPDGYLPGSDTNGDGAVSINEGLGRSVPVMHTGPGPLPNSGSITLETDIKLGQSQGDIDGPYSTRWVVGMDRPTALQRGAYVYNVFVRNQIADKTVTYQIGFHDVSGAVYRTRLTVPAGRVSADTWTAGDSFDPKLVRVSIAAS